MIQIAIETKIQVLQGGKLLRQVHKYSTQPPENSNALYKKNSYSSFKRRAEAIEVDLETIYIQNSETFMDVLSLNGIG